jgi:ribosome recycling factor
MDPRVKEYYEETRVLMDKAIIHTETELTKLRAGKALPSMLDQIYVDYYGNSTALSQVANVNTPDARTLIIQPWEKNLIPAIEKAITEANLGFNPQNDGSLIRINIPPLTEERRKDLVKKAKAESEQGKITIRNFRKDVNDKVKRLLKDGLSEDEIKISEGEVQKLTDSYIIKIDKIIEAKEKDILTI